jgi:hypothetical protein
MVDCVIDVRVVLRVPDTALGTILQKARVPPPYIST